jgi:hypothetical protein
MPAFAASDPNIQPKVQGGRQGDSLVVRSGGEIVLESGAKLWSQGIDISDAIGSTAAGVRVVAGQITTATAADTVVTGLATVVAAFATLDSDPSDNPLYANATIGNQTGAPAAGSIIVKTWQDTGGTDPSPTAATTFAKKVNWLAVGS